MTRVITLCLVIAIVSTSATACRKAWRASRPVRGGARVVREIARPQDQTSRAEQTPTPDMAKTAITYYNRGVAKHDLGEYADAIADYDEAIRLQPDHASAYYNRGNAKYALGEYEAAITDYDEAIRLQPDYVLAYNNRGLIKYTLGEYAAAIADFDIAIELQPDNADAYDYRDIASRALERTE